MSYQQEVTFPGSVSPVLATVYDPVSPADVSDPGSHWLNTAGPTSADYYIFSSRAATSNVQVIRDILLDPQFSQSAITGFGTPAAKAYFFTVLNEIVTYNLNTGLVESSPFVADGLLYLLDYGNNRVVALDPDNSYAQSFTFTLQSTVANMQFAMDDHNDLFLGDGAGGGSMYSSNGRLLDTFTLPTGDYTDPFTNGIAPYLDYTPDGHVFVFDTTGTHQFDVVPEPGAVALLMMSGVGLALRSAASGPAVLISSWCGSIIHLVRAMNRWVIQEHFARSPRRHQSKSLPLHFVRFLNKF